MDERKLRLPEHAHHAQAGRPGHSAEMHESWGFLERADLPLLAQNSTILRGDRY